MMIEALGAPALPDTEAKAIELALSTWTLLKLLGYTQEQADIAIEYAPNLEIEEAAAFLLFHHSEQEMSKLSLSTLESKTQQPKKALDLDYASAVDETYPPRHNAYSFERDERGRLVVRGGTHYSQLPVTTMNSLPPGMAARVHEETQMLLQELDDFVDDKSPWVDVIELPIDTYCTARIALLRLDQEKKRREKILGQHLDYAVSEAAHQPLTLRQFGAIAFRANDLMQQAEMQPSFNQKVAAERFKERMRKDSEDRAQSRAKVPVFHRGPRANQPQAAAQPVDDRARRRAEVERAMRGDEPEPAAEQKPTEAEKAKSGSEEAKDVPPHSSNTDGRPAKPAEAPAESTAKETAEPAKEASAKAESAADGKDADEPEESMFGTMLDETEGSESNQSVRLRPIANSLGGRSPRTVLLEQFKRIDSHAVIRFTPVSGGGYINRTLLEIRWNPLEQRGSDTVVLDTYKLTNEGCVSQTFADDLIATVALNALCRDRQVQRSLPPGYRAFWDELDAARDKEKQVYNRLLITHMRELLERRAKHPAPQPRARRTVKKGAEAPEPQNEQTKRPPERIVEEYEMRRATEAYQAMQPGREQLPIAASRQQILESVAQSQVVVLSGETGCGKSTQLPAFLLEDALARGQPCKIYVTEPRRISAISLAERVSKELGEAPGAIGGPDSYIGYAIRLDSQIGRNAQLIYATTGIALRMLESGAFDEITHIIIDEVHERSIESDFLLMVLKVIMQQRPELKIVLMSATLDAERISEYFGGCPMLHVPGRTFPVDEYYLEDVLELCDYTLEPNSPYALEEREKRNSGKQAGDEDDDEEEVQPTSTVSGTKVYSPKTLDTLARLNEYTINYDLIAALLRKVFTDSQFDAMNRAVLVFLPGFGEIRQCESALSGHREFAPQHCQIHILHSSIAPEEQAEAFKPPPPGMRKVVLATNIAETGITIPDITCVIDAGRHREMRYDEKRKISRLVECFIARSNAKQRRGRAGRVQHGMCFHLFTKMRHDQIMEAHPLPEMLRLSLQELALTLKVMKIKVGTSIEDALSQALDPPQAINVQRAVASLVEVQALTPNEEITPLGRHLCHMPLDVHLGKFLLIATRFQCLDSALSIAAMLNCKSPFLRTERSRFRTTSRSQFTAHRNDFFSFINVYKRWRKFLSMQRGAHFCQMYAITPDGMYQVEELRQQYLSYLADAGFVTLSKELRRDLARSRSRQGRPLLIDVPPELNTYGESVHAINLALVAALYPKVLWMESHSDELRTITNNQQAFIHPSSANFSSFPSATSTHFLLYHAIIMSKRLYAWDTAYVDELNVLLAGGEPEFKHGSRSLFLDHNRVRMSISDARSLLALRVLRSQLAKNLHASFNQPGLKWDEEERLVFAVTLEALGASFESARSGVPDSDWRQYR